ncbi:MAG: iron-sulfur cluster assembly protein [Candidatus Electryonea clarkiae]|nr:iron-sulfur cluster assembly protein [Candidatus Electryonea clarkiae]MDP8288466.1 iron-sulfur cluster assembly protein [Candidatus Electryonea clarkiae]
MLALTEEIIMDSLLTVMDPELHISIVDLGLIYNVNIKDNDEIHVLMTLTTPGCPLATSIAEQAEKAVMETDGVKDVLIEIVFEPPWNVNMMSDFAKDKLGI